MALLPLKLPWISASDRWATIINPVMALPPNQGTLVSNVKLIVGTNVVNHLLGKKQQGWLITDINGSAKIYRSAAFNALTLTLVSDTAVTVSFWMF